MARQFFLDINYAAENPAKKQHVRNWKGSEYNASFRFSINVCQKSEGSALAFCAPEYFIH